MVRSKSLTKGGKWVEGWKLLTRLWSEEANGKKGGGERVVWRLLTRLWSEETKRAGESGRNGGGVETPDASLVRGNQKKQEKGRGRQEDEKKGGEEG